MTAIAVSDPSALRDLMIANRILANEGVLDAFGHVSIRHPDRPDHYVISRSLGPAYVSDADLQCYTIAGELVSGDERPGYVERPIHAAIYEARPDVMAICHNHSPSVIPYGVTGTALRPIFHAAALIGADIPTWDIADEWGDTDLLVRTMEQGRSLARLLGPRTTALMRGHGSVVAGPNLKAIAQACIYMERNALLQMQATALGAVRYLTPGEVAAASAMLQEPVVSTRTWNVWREKVGLSE
ncbi:MAG TPA: class II aldolase/adducin family protein [Chloroflexota bacterium]